MPKQPKFTREEIAEAAYEILRREGETALTARHLGDVLGSSARPIFTVFSNMSEVREAAMERARDLYRDYISEGLTQVPPFKGSGMAYIRFAIEEPELFRILFMSDRMGPEPMREVLVKEENYERILASMKAFYGLPREKAEKLYEHLWLYTHGIAALAATRVGTGLMLDEVSRMLTEVFQALLPAMKGEDE